MPGIREGSVGVLCALAIGSMPVLTRAEPAPGAVGPLVAAYNASGQQLFQVLARNPGNIVLSPFSIGTAMAMALDGARGDTEAEMAKVLGLTLSRDDVNAANAAVLASLNGVSATD